MSFIEYPSVASIGTSILENTLQKKHQTVLSHHEKVGYDQNNYEKYLSFTYFCVYFKTGIIYVGTMDKFKKATLILKNSDVSIECNSFGYEQSRIGF